MKILHIPKTGGTAIKASLIDGYKRHPRNIKYLPTKIKDLYICDHRQKLDNKDNYIFFVRDPIQRFISHFIFLKRKAEEYDTYGYFKNLDLEDKVLNKYENINELAGDIGHLKFNLMIKMSDILGGPENIRACRKNILFVGMAEYLSVDFLYMQRQLCLGTSYKINKEYSNRRPSKYDDMTELYQSSRWKLRQYLNLDYEIIRELTELGFIKDYYLYKIKY